MALTGEAKREWRRKNRAEIAACTAAWYAAHPDAVKRHAAQAAARSRQKSADRRTQRMLDDPDYARAERHREKVRSDAEYAASAAECDRERKEEFARIRKDRAALPWRAHSPADGWNWQTVGSLAKRANNREARARLSNWEKKCETLARGIRYSATKLRAHKKADRKAVGWMERAATLAGRLNSQAKRQWLQIAAPTGSTATRHRWAERSSAICKNMRVRALAKEAT